MVSYTKGKKKADIWNATAYYKPSVGKLVIRPGEPNIFREEKPPEEKKTPFALPCVEFNGKKWYWDERLRELRSVKEPWDNIHADDFFVKERTGYTAKERILFIRTGGITRFLALKDCREVI